MTNGQGQRVILGFGHYMAITTLLASATCAVVGSDWVMYSTMDAKHERRSEIVDERLSSQSQSINDMSDNVGAIGQRVTAVETKVDERHEAQLRKEAQQIKKLDKVLELIQGEGD